MTPVEGDVPFLSGIGLSPAHPPNLRLVADLPTVRAPYLIDRWE